MKETKQFLSVLQKHDAYTWMFVYSVHLHVNVSYVSESCVQKNAHLHLHVCLCCFPSPLPGLECMFVWMKMSATPPPFVRSGQ